MGNRHSSLTGYAAWFALLLYWSSAAWAQPVEPLASEVERGMALWNVPGMSVSVVGPDDVRFMQGFGKASTGRGDSVDEHTMFAIASTTKAMVVAGLLILVDEGKLSLDDKVTQHIPELQFKSASLTKQATLRDLLAHRTGLPSTDIWTFLQSVPLAEQIRLLQLVDQEAPARSRLIYQNTMFELAGLIMERISGQRWDDFLADRLWRPIGMLETYGTRGDIPADKTRVSPYEVVNGTLVQSDWNFDADFADAAGSVWSSAHDMARWAQFLLRDAVTEDGKRLISEAGVAEMFEPHQLASPADFYPTVALTKPDWRTYGLGWFQQNFQGRKIDFHTGSLSGLIAIIGLDRANGKAVIVLGNRDHAEMRHAILWHTMDLNEGAHRRDWNQDVFDLYETARLNQLEERSQAESARLSSTRPALPLEEYAGVYQNPVLGEVTVVLENESLVLNFVRASFAMRHWHLETFQIVDGRFDFRAFSGFSIDPQGKVSGLSVFDQPFTRAQPCGSACVADEGE